MTRVGTIATLLLGGLLHAGALSAQDQVYAAGGTGSLLTGDAVARQEIARVEATLYGNGGIDLRLIQGRDSWIFRGSWYGSAASGSVGFRLDSGFELPADGSGRLYLQGRALGRLNFRGSNRDGAFELTFAGQGGGGEGQGHGAAALDVTRDGDGDLDLGDDGDRLDRARIILDADGGAEIRLWGATRYTLTGSWSGTLASGRVRLRITSWGRDDATLGGTLNTSRRSGWDRLALDGTALQRTVRLSFAGEGPGLDSGDQDDGAPEEPARPLTTLDQTMRGAGDLTLDDGTGAALRAVRVNLRRGGKAELTLEGSQPKLTLRGQWSQRDNAPRIDLSITEGLGRAGTSGVGTLTLPDGSHWERLNLSGRNDKGGWKVLFRANGPGHLTLDTVGAAPEPEPIREFHATQHGEGTLTWPGVRDPSTVTQVKVSLGADSKAVIEIEGSRPARFTGRWATTSRPDRLGVALTGGTIAGLLASGTITLADKGMLSGLTIEGRVIRVPVRLSFRALSTPPPVPPVH